MMAYEKIKESKILTDIELLNELQKTYNVTLRQLNDALLHLEISGLIRVYRVGKDKKRIELSGKSGDEVNLI
jgi:hypothetical protein